MTTNDPLTNHRMLLTRAVSVAVSSLSDASQKFRAYIDENDLGASDMSRGSGDVYDAKGLKIAHISYNGRVWQQEGVEIPA